MVLQKFGMMVLALGYGRKQRTRKKREKVSFTGDTVTVTGSKRAKEQKRWSAVQKRKSLDEEIEDDNINKGEGSRMTQKVGKSIVGWLT
jgi:hypothetical protein